MLIILSNGLLGTKDLDVDVEVEVGMTMECVMLDMI